MTHIMIKLGIGQRMLRSAMKHGSRHRRSQMKAIVKGRFKGKGARFGL